MAETIAERMNRLGGAPPKPQAAMGHSDPNLQEHIAFSLWRIANLMEESNQIERDKFQHQLHGTYPKPKA